jgi:hypothetical protein
VSLTPRKGDYWLLAPLRVRHPFSSDGCSGLAERRMLPLCNPAVTSSLHIATLLIAFLIPDCFGFETLKISRLGTLAVSSSWPMSPVDSLVDRIAAERQAPGRGRQIRPLAVAHKFLPLHHPFTHLSGLSNERARPLEAAAKAITTGSISLIDIQSLPSRASSPSVHQSYN